MTWYGVDRLSWQARAARAVSLRARTEERAVYRRDMKRKGYTARAADQLWPTVKHAWRVERGWV